MKLNQIKLTNYLTNIKNQKKNSFYWLNSEDCFFLQETSEEIKQALKSIGYTERLTFHIDTSINWNEITNIIQIPNLFNTNQIIELVFTNQISTTEQQELINIAKLANKYNIICIVVYPFRLDSKTLKQKWLAELDSHGIIITIWPLSEAEYPIWLKKECQKNQISFADQNLFYYFCQKTANNTTAAIQILYKLNLQEIKQVTTESLTAIISEHANYDIFDLTDQYLMGNIKKCFTILNTLKQNNTAPLLIIWAIKKELDILTNIHEKTALTNQSAILILEDYHFWQNKKNIFITALNNPEFNLQLLYKKLEQISQIELLIKTENNPTFIWQKIQELLLINIVNFAEPLNDT